MARTKIALLHCAQAHEGPWLRPQGGEVGVNVFPELMEGEVVVVDIQSEHSSRAVHHECVPSGYSPLPLAKSHRYRVRKLGNGTPTNVEVVFNGRSPS